MIKNRTEAKNETGRYSELQSLKQADSSKIALLKKVKFHLKVELAEPVSSLKESFLNDQIVCSSGQIISSFVGCIHAKLCAFLRNDSILKIVEIVSQ